MYKRTIVVVDDDEFLRSLIANSLESADFNVLTAENASDARRVINSVDPDAVVLDIDLGRGPTGFDIANNLRKTSKGVGIVFLTNIPDPRFGSAEIFEVASNEAYLNKHLISDAKVIVEAINSVLSESELNKFRHHQDKDRPLASLTKTQIQLLQLISEGKSNQEIAKIRQRSVAATEGSIGRLFGALGIESSENINSRVAASRKLLEVIRPKAL